MEKILVTGGAGFIGSTLSLDLKAKFPKAKVIALDNLKRRGSEAATQRLKKAGVEFVHGDVRVIRDVLDVGPVDLIMDCAAEPSVSAGMDGATEFLVSTNLGGTVHCLELARQCKATFILLSTSRIYPFRPINNFRFRESSTRFEIEQGFEYPGLSKRGISEKFPLEGVRSLYGATKLSSEHLVEEYANMFGLNYVINRCSVVSGPWQMGKVDQGFIVLWVARHLYGGALKYMGFGGTGKQVRDIIHVADLSALIMKQIDAMSRISGQTFNVGGGVERTISLCELTQKVQSVSGKKIEIQGVPETHPNDCIYFCADNAKVEAALDWKPQRSMDQLVADVYQWISSNSELLRPFLT